MGHFLLSLYQPKFALWPSNSTSWNISEETWNTNLKEYTHPYVHCSVVYNCQILKHFKCPSVDERIKKLWYKLHNGILLGHRKEGNLTFCDSVDEPGEHYAKWNKAVRESQMPSSIQFHLYVKSNKQNKLTNKIETDS